MRGSSSLANRPSLIEYNNFKFLVMDAPTDANIQHYIEILKKNDASVLVRACEPTYSANSIIDSGVRVEEMAFADGDPPPDEIVTKWLDLVDKEFFSKESPRTIAVHCVAGLGRAPGLVAIALIEAGMDPLDAIELIRKKRRGAINSRQLKYIEGYKRRRRRNQDCIGKCDIL
jgi:protein tyrosine phosphatase type 4A